MECVLDPLYLFRVFAEAAEAARKGLGLAKDAVAETESALGTQEAAWLSRFWSGDRKAIEQVYVEHFDAVFAAAGRILTGADQETVAHEVFMRMVAEESFRRRFTGGSLRAWLSTVARNRAIDFYRKRAREEMTDHQDLEQVAGNVDADRFIEQGEARRLVQRFRNEVLPEKWKLVFEARFVRALSQRDAADELSMSRTTLAYQEIRIRSLLKGFMLDLERSAE